MKQTEHLDTLSGFDFVGRHETSIKYFEGVLSGVGKELKKLQSVKNADADIEHRIKKLRQIQKNTKHNLEITKMFASLKRPYGI